MSKDTPMTASEEDRALAANIVASLPPFSQRTKRNDVVSEQLIAASFATIRARAAAEATERAAKIADAEAEHHAEETWGWNTAKDIAAAIRADLTAGQPND